MIDDGYFRDQRTIVGIPNFWNVASNLPFLLVAILGVRALRRPAAFLHRWERASYAILLCGVPSVVWWRLSGDLRLYAIVQFYPMLALPLMLLGMRLWM